MEESSSIMFLRGCSRFNQAVTVVVFISFKVATGFTVKDSRQIRLRNGREEMRWKTGCTHIFTGKLPLPPPIIISHYTSELPKQKRGLIITVFLAICHLNQITTLGFKNISPTCCRKWKLHSRVRKQVIGCVVRMAADRRPLCA